MQRDSSVVLEAAGGSVPSPRPSNRPLALPHSEAVATETPPLVGDEAPTLILEEELWQQLPLKHRRNRLLIAS